MAGARQSRQRARVDGLNPITPARTKPESAEKLALGCFLVWTGGAIVARWIGMWAGIGGAAILLAGGVLIRNREATLRRLRPQPALIAAGVLLGLIMVGATYLLYPLAGRLVGSIPTQTASLYATFGGVKGLVRLILLPVIVISEELVWRGAVQDGLERRLGRGPAVVAGAALYSLAHLPAGGLLALIALACGLYWNAIRAASGSLLPGLIAHLLWDVVLLVLWPLAPPG